jgi:hypothetical protein
MAFFERSGIASGLSWFVRYDLRFARGYSSVG